MSQQAWRFSAIFLVLSALACNAPVAGGVPTAAPALEPTAGATSAPATPVPGPTVTVAAPAILPAPLYFVNASDQQIWRIEMDATTQTPVTAEPLPVDNFDVSSTDGTVVYVSSNSIYTVDALGGARTLRVQGPPLSQDDLNTVVGAVQWSPGGARFMYNLSGVNLFDIATGQSQVVLANDPIDANNPGQYNLYFPESWSPDGARLLIGRSLYATDAYWLSVLNLADGSLTDMQGRICCYPTWSADGTAIYLANDQFGMFFPGLWRVDAATGASTTLVQDMPDSADPPALPIRLFNSPFQASDGQFYVFQGALDAVPEEFGTNYPLTMHRANADGSNATALRSDSHVIGEALWARNARGAVIMDITSQVGPGVSPEYPVRGDLIWLPADGSPAVPLGITGRLLRWGSGS